MMGTKGSSIVEVVVVVDSIVVEVVDNMDMETVRMLRIVVVVVVADYCSQMIGLGLDYSLMKNVQLEQLLKLLVYLYLSLVEQLKSRITIYNQLPIRITDIFIQLFRKIKVSIQFGTKT